MEIRRTRLPRPCNHGINPPASGAIGRCASDSQTGTARDDEVRLHVKEKAPDRSGAFEWFSICGARLEGLDAIGSLGSTGRITPPDLAEISAGSDQFAK